MYLVILILYAKNLLFLDILILVFECAIVFIGYPLVVLFISERVDQSVKQTEAR